LSDELAKISLSAADKSNALPWGVKLLKDSGYSADFLGFKVCLTSCGRSSYNRKTERVLSFRYLRRLLESVAPTSMMQPNVRFVLITPWPNNSPQSKVEKLLIPEHSSSLFAGALIASQVT